MSWVTIIMDPDDNKVKIDWFYLKKIIIGTIRGDQFLYISLEFDYKHSFCCYSIFLLILRSPPLGSSFSFILPSFFHLHPPRVDQVVDFHSYPISTLLKSLGVAVRLKITVLVSLLH